MELDNSQLVMGFSRLHFHLRNMAIHDKHGLRQEFQCFILKVHMIHHLPSAQCNSCIYFIPHCNWVERLQTRLRLHRLEFCGNFSH